MSSEATLTFSLIAKDLASGNIQKVATGLSGLQKAGGLVGPALKGAGVLAAGGFAAMSAGALQAQDAQGKFMAATGASRDEAKLFVSSMDGIAGSAGTVGMSFDQIAKVGTDVANQFGTTGQATADLTDKFSAFAKVTGQDADQAVLGLNDTMTAFGEPTKNAAADMDLLIASHQKFGTDVGPTTIATLQKIGPVLTALGGDFTDGVGLMNAFETAGVDANGAMKDLTAVVKNFPPGTTLDSVITKLGQAKGPADLLNQSIGIFGDKMGPAMAKVIQPGMTSLDDFKVSAQDAQGATDTAAGAMETDAQKFQGFVDKVGAGARELGQNFGPALTGLASLGTLAGSFGGDKIAGAAVAGLKALVAKVLPSAAASGAAIGTAEGEAETEASAGTGMISKWLAKFGLQTATKVTAAAAAGEAEGAAEGTASAEAMGGAGAVGAAGTAGTAVAGGFLATFAPLLAMGGAGAAVLLLPQILDHLTGQDATSKIATVGSQMADHFATGYTDQVRSQYSQVVQDAYDKSIAAAGPFLFQANYDAAQKAAYTAGQAFLAASGPEPYERAGSANAQAFVAAAADTFDHDSRAPFTAAGAKAATVLSTGFTDQVDRHASDFSNAAMNVANQTGHSLAQGLIQSLPNVDSAWKQFLKDEKDMLDPGKMLAKLEGEDSSKALAEALHSKNPLVRERAYEQQQAIESQIGQLKTLLGQDGTTASNALAAHIDDGKGKAVSAVSAMVASINAQIAQINGNVHVNVNAGQIAKYNLPRFAAGGRYQANTLAVVGDAGRPELFMSDQSGYITPTVPGGSTSARGENHFHLHLDSTLPASPAQAQAAAMAFIPELVRELRRQRISI